jgi:CRISPR-associated endonuclease/helicase Cas3
MQDLVLHLIAAHHGRARPHFSEDEVFDRECPEADAAEMSREVPRRFARLQRKYGRWGLAYLESLLRAADYAASAEPSSTVGDER